MQIYSFGYGWREKTIGVGNSLQFIPMVLMTMSGNVSKCGADVVVGTLFNKQPRKCRKRPLCKHKRKVAMIDLTGWVDIYFLLITLVIFVLI